MSSDQERSVEGGSTYQHVTGAEETDVFPTDQPPSTTTPASSGSNAGINATRANHPDFNPEDPDALRTP